MSSQQISSIIRQVLAVVVSIYGVLSACVASLHLPVVVSAVLTAMGPLMLTIEHYVSDPSTGRAITHGGVASPGVQPSPDPNQLQ